MDSAEINSVRVSIFAMAHSILAMVHFFPLAIMLLLAVQMDTPPTNDLHGPVIFSFRAEQWVTPPVLGSFAVILGCYQDQWSPVVRSSLMFVGWCVVAISVLCFGLASLWRDGWAMIDIYSLTTPFLVIPMAVMAWRELKRAIFGGRNV